MKIEEILQNAGRNKRRHRVGRGNGSGWGTTAGRGNKGAGQRSGTSNQWNKEGGQNAAIARLPKRGFSNADFRKEFQIVNVQDLERFDDGQRVDLLALSKARLIDAGGNPVKVLGHGELTKKLTVVAARFSASAAEKIQKVGGSVEQG